MTVTLDLPDGWEDLRLPPAVANRLQALLDRQDAGDRLTPDDRVEAGALVELAEMLAVLRLRRQRGGAREARGWDRHSCLSRVTYSSPVLAGWPGVRTDEYIRP